jgi:toxin ParE1/3/4
VRVRWSRRAVGDLRHARAYIEEHDPEAARHVAARILSAAESLSTFPARGRAGRVFGTRELVVSGTPYVVIYRVKGDVVEIARVLHGARRWPT